MEAVESTGEKLKVDLVAVPASTADDFAGALSRISDKGAAALLVVASPVLAAGRVRLAELALKHRLPAMFSTRADASSRPEVLRCRPQRPLSTARPSIIDKILEAPSRATCRLASNQVPIRHRSQDCQSARRRHPPNVLALADEVIDQRCRCARLAHRDIILGLVSVAFGCITIRCRAVARSLALTSSQPTAIRQDKSGSLIAARTRAQANLFSPILQPGALAAFGRDGSNATDELAAEVWHGGMETIFLCELGAAAALSVFCLSASPSIKADPRLGRMADGDLKHWRFSFL